MTTESERLLQVAAEAQAAFWQAITDLENDLGFEVDSTRDLDGLTVEDLKAARDFARAILAAADWAERQGR